MKLKNILTVAFSCLLVLETPMLSQAASFSPASKTERSQESSSEETGNPDSQKINLNYEAYRLNAGTVLQLTASLSSGQNQSSLGFTPEIIWTSSQPDIAQVSSQGLVSAYKAGSAVITAKADFPSENGVHTISASCSITVANTISLDKTSIALYPGQTGQLYAKTAPAGTIAWKSSNEAVAKVTSGGQIVSVSPGAAVITAEANGVSASCQVSVKKPALKLKSSAVVFLGSSASLKAEATPNTKITWKSSNKKVAAVSSTGKVTPKKKGTATITASANGLKKTCKVTVKNPSAKLNTKEVTLFAEDCYSLNVAAHPSSKLTYRSSDPKVAKVDKRGKITAIRQGSATITASVPGAKASCNVTVLKNNYELSRTSQTLMKGSSATIYLFNASEADAVSFDLSNNSVAELSYSGNVCQITAKKTGKTTLNAYCSTYQDGKKMTCKHSCSIRVINSGIVQQQAAIAVKTSQKLELKRVEKSNASITKTVWESSNPKVASVSQKTGKVTGKKVGTAKITATVSYSDGTSTEYQTSLKVSSPRASYSRTIVSLGHSQKIALSGLTSYSTVQWKVKKNSLISVSSDGTITAGNKTGKTTVNINVDGKTIKHTVVVSNPGLKTSYAAVAIGKTAKIKLTGVNPESIVTYRSKKSSIATVSKSGVVTGKKSGNTEIVVTADGNTFNFQVQVAPKRAVDACAAGYKIMYSSSYSQARRMSKGYYDCSSLVFRAYGCDSKLLGGTPSWAPTAAAMAAHMENTGKVISYRGLSASKLRPGDLIFYRAPYSNGRYKNIYHVSMYYGNGYRLEKPLRYYSSGGNIAMIARPVSK